MGFQLGGATYQEASSEQLMKTMHTAFITFSVICAVGIFVSIQRRSKDR
jgi:integral membrane sensor domain MASE1